MEMRRKKAMDAVWPWPGLGGVSPALRKIELGVDDDVTQGTASAS